MEDDNISIFGGSIIDVHAITNYGADLMVKANTQERKHTVTEISLHITQRS